MTHFFNTNPHFLRDYPELGAELLGDYFELSDRPKGDVEKDVFRKLRRRVPVLTMLSDLWKAKKALM